METLCIAKVLFGVSLGLGTWVLTYVANRAWCAFWRMIS